MSPRKWVKEAYSGLGYNQGDADSCEKLLSAPMHACPACASITHSDTYLHGKNTKTDNHSVRSDARALPGWVLHLQTLTSQERTFYLWAFRSRAACSGHVPFLAGSPISGYASVVGTERLTVTYAQVYVRVRVVGLPSSPRST